MSDPLQISCTPDFEAGVFRYKATLDLSKVEPVFVGFDIGSGPDKTAFTILPAPPCEGGRTKPRWISPSLVIRIAAALYSIEESELLSRRRNPRFEQARALVVWCLRAITAEPMSYPKIGRHMDGRDHSTAINLHVNAIALRLSDEGFDQHCIAMQRYFILTNGGAHERA